MSLTRGYVEDIGSAVGIQSYEQGTKGWCPGMCVDIIPDRYGYVMAVLSGARVVRVLSVCVAATC